MYVIIIMYILNHALIKRPGRSHTHINLNTIFYTHVEHTCVCVCVCVCFHDDDDELMLNVLRCHLTY